MSKALVQQTFNQQHESVYLRAVWETKDLREHNLCMSRSQLLSITRKDVEHHASENVRLERIPNNCYSRLQQHRKQNQMIVTGLRNFCRK